MSKELYFLRSSEQKIVIDMFKHAHPNSSEELAKYTEFYGLSTKDLGLYAMVNHKIAGAIWSRQLEHQATPRVSFAILPEFAKQGVGIFMMEQFLQEAGALYEEIEIDITHKPKAFKFYKKFGFEKINNSFLLSKKLEKKEVFRPTDGYDANKWIE